MKKKGLVWGTIIPWLIALGVLVLMIILYIALTNKGQNALDFIKNLIRFGR